MIDATLAQLFNHIIEKELEGVQKDQRIELLEQELLKYTKDVATMAPKESQGVPLNKS